MAVGDFEQPDSDERRGTTEDRGTQLVAQRCAGVADLWSEVLSNQGAQDCVDGAPEDTKTEDRGYEQRPGFAGVEDPIVREHEHDGTQRTCTVEDAPVHAVGNRAEDWHPDGCDESGCRDCEQDRVVAGAEDIGRVGDDVGSKDIERSSFSGFRGDRNQDRAPVLGHNFLDRQLELLALFAHAAELRGVIEAVTDPQTNQHEHNRGHEWDAPAPQHELVFWHEGQQRHHGGGEQHTERDTHLRYRAVEAAPVAWRVFVGEQ